jgi:hypothetical protein
MFVDVVDYLGRSLKIDSRRVLKMRPAILADEPHGCTFIDYVSGGVFARGELAQAQGLFAPYVRWAALHAPNKTPMLINVDGIAAVLGPDSQYAQANTIAVAAVGFENQNDPARNKIPLKETMAEVQVAFDGADARRALI